MSNPQHPAFLAFNHAEQFRIGVGFLNRSHDFRGIVGPVAQGVQEAPYPLLLLAHQATELYLKSVRLSCGIDQGDDHNTWNLFRGLDRDPHQLGIEDYYSSVLDQSSLLQEVGDGQDPGKHFRTTLKAIGGRYNDLRYIFESGKQLPTGRVLNSGFVMEAIRRYAVESLMTSGNLYLLLVEAENVDGEMVEKDGGEKRPINRDTPNLRDELNLLFGMRVSDDPFSLFDLDPVILNSED